MATAPPGPGLREGGNPAIRSSVLPRGQGKEGPPDLKGQSGQPGGEKSTADFSKENDPCKGSGACRSWP